MTLLFLGDVPEARLPDLVAGAAPAVAAASRMTLQLAGGGRFGSLRRPQVAWAGLEGDVRPLAELAGRLATLARSLQLVVEERPFRPHLTLGRWRPGRPADGAVVERLAGYRGPAWSVSEVSLLDSHLGAAPHYDRVAAWGVEE